MATALLSPPPTVSISTSTTSSPLSSAPPPLSRNHIKSNAGNKRNRLLCRSSLSVACSGKPISGICLQRRELFLFTLSTSASLVLPSPALSEPEEEDVKMEMFVDETNAYSFMYPLVLPSNNLTLKWIESRKPERYSSAAPLSPDAHLRIVSERLDIINNIVISVSIGPPNSNYLTSNFKDAWNAKDVADSVLADKSSLRVTTSQRMQESSVLDAHASEINGEPYWYYEYIVRKSPTKTAPESNLFRHFVASTAERDGYLYTLNASTLSKQWGMVGPFLQQTVASFRLIPPTESYVPPFKDPWRFW